MIGYGGNLYEIPNSAFKIIVTILGMLRNIFLQDFLPQAACTGDGIVIRYL